MDVLRMLVQKVFTGVVGPVLRRFDDHEGRVRTTARVDALLHGLKGRLSDKDYQWALENSGQAEWDIAVTTIHEAMARKELTFRDDEAAELARIESQQRFKW